MGMGLGSSQSQTPASAPSKILGTPGYLFRNDEFHHIICLSFALQNFPRISAEEPESFTPRRTHEDDKDPDPFRTGSAHEMGSIHTKRSGKTSASHPSRARADASGSEEDDCIILEVFDPLPLSYALPVMPVLADRGRHVLEHVTPLAAEVGDTPASRVRKASALEAGSSGTPASKRQKITSTGPPRKKKWNTIPTSSG
jgi:hypothetical protein